MMPRINTGSDGRFLALVCGAVLMTAAALGSLMALSRAEDWWLRPENTQSVPDDRRGPQLEQALKSLSDAWREENRNR